jgi:hypothetical protein
MEKVQVALETITSVVARVAGRKSEMRKREEKERKRSCEKL